MMTTYRLSRLIRHRKNRESRGNHPHTASQVAVVLTLILTVAAGPVVAQQNADRAAFAAERGYSIAPVMVDGRILLRVLGVTAYPAPERAAKIADRIRHVAEDSSVSSTSLRLVENEHSTDIFVGDQLIMSVLDADARIEGAGGTRALLGRLYLNRIKAAVDDYRAERTPEQLLRDTATALGATLAAVLAIFIIMLLLRFAERRIRRRYQSAMEEIESKSFRLVSAASLWKAVHSALRLLSIVAIVVLLFIYFHFLLGLFPWTRGLATSFEAMTLAPLFELGHAIIIAIPSLLVLVLIALGANYALKLTRSFFSAIKRGRLTISGFEPEWSDSTYNLVRVLVIAFAVIVCYPHIPGSESPAFKGVTIFIGLLFSLGSSAFLASLIAGYTMTYRRAFRIGDRVKVGDLMGDVTEVGLMVTHLRSLKNEEFVIPNSTILNTSLINYSSIARDGGLILHTTVGIGYETPWRQVEAMLLMAAERTPGLLRHPPPFILQKSLDDFSVAYELNVYCNTPHAMFQLYTQLHRSILDVFNEHGVQVMTPSYVADPDQPKIVPKGLWFASPAHALSAQETNNEKAPPAMDKQAATGRP